MTLENKAKCLLCGSVVQSYGYYDRVSCTCGEIAIWGGDREFLSTAKDYKNFVRIDEKGNEIAVKVEEKEQAEKCADEGQNAGLSRAELLTMLEEEAKYWQKLPAHALYQPVSHEDHYRLASLLLAIFRAS